MRKLITLCLALLASLPLTTNANTTKERDDSRYLAGAVPEVDGKVVFSKEFQIAGKSQDEIYDTLLKWMTDRLQENKNDKSRVVYTNKEAGSIAGIGEEWLVFSSSALSLDRTLLDYQITVTCKPASCLVELEKIRYTYRETEKYKAEEWITDKYALNKAKTKLVRGLAKWRRKTVDFADDLFMDVAVAFGAPDTRPRTDKKRKDEQPAPNIVEKQGPVVIGAPTQEQAPQVTPLMPVAKPEQPKQEANAQQPLVVLAPRTPQYVTVDLKQIPGEVYALMGSSKLVVSIGKDEFNMTNMTANAGGALGYLSGKAVAYCTLAADQSTDALDKADTYTLKLYPQGETTPRVIIECKKLPAQAAPVAGQPRTYVGEITKLSQLK